MSRERMPEGVRVDRALRCCGPGPRAQAPPDVRRGEPPAALGEEQRGLAGTRVQDAPGALQVPAHGGDRVLPGGDEAGLAALALDAHLLPVEVQRDDVEVDE